MSFVCLNVQIQKTLHVLEVKNLSFIMASCLVLLVSVINLFANVFEPCLSIVATGPNAKYFEVASQFMDDAQLFFSSEDKEAMFSHITDDFIWHWEGDKTISKNKFIELNEALYGMNSRSYTQFLADAIGDRYCGGVSYAWFERGDKPCKSWMFTWEVFIFQDPDTTDTNSDENTEAILPKIKERYSFPVNKRVYTKNNEMLSSPKCKWKKEDTWDYAREEEIEERLETKMMDYFMYKELFYRKRDSTDNQDDVDLEKADDETVQRLFYGIVADNIIFYDAGANKNESMEAWRNMNDRWYNKFDEYDLLYELDIVGEYFTGGFVHSHVRIGECKFIMMDLVIAYFDWDIDMIQEIVTLPVDETRQKEFIKCVEEQTKNESKDDGSKKEL